jgi:hypothetical protein
METGITTAVLAGANAPAQVNPDGVEDGAQDDVLLADDGPRGIVAYEQAGPAVVSAKATVRGLPSGLRTSSLSANRGGK